MKIMKGMKDVKTILGMIAIALVAAVPLAAQDHSSKPPAGVAGNWNMSVAGQDGAMVATMALAQDGKKVTGTLNSEHSGEVAVDGQFADGKLTFSIVVHGGSAQEMKMEFAGLLKADGTLAGTLSGPMGDMTWTASRVK